MIITGTLINTGTVLVGGLLGSFIYSKTGEKISKAIFHIIGLFNIYLGIKMALDTHHILLIIGSLISGVIVGEIIDIDNAVNKIAEKVKIWLKIKNQQFSEGITTAFLIFCIGSMTILGTIEEGLGKYPNLLITKALMDGFASFLLATSLGIGVAFSSIPLFLFQSALTLSARWIHPYLTPELVTEINGVGGILLLGLGIHLLEIKKIKIINLLPSLIFVVLFYFLIKLF